MGHANGRHREKRRDRVTARADAIVRDNVRTIARLEEASRDARALTDRVVDAISSFCGSLAFVYVHAIWFGGWIAVNLSPLRGIHFDSYPFGLLTMVVSLEAIFLSTFILITQNRQSRTADRRNHLDLQINLLAEQENTKMLRMLQAIHDRLDIREKDPEVAVLEQATKPEKVVQEIERYVEETSVEKGPLSVPKPAPSVRGS
jgi:uncharacterized membrane protein